MKSRINDNKLSVSGVELLTVFPLSIWFAYVWFSNGIKFPSNVYGDIDATYQVH